MASELLNRPKVGRNALPDLDLFRLARLARVRQGNLGDCKSVGEGVSELRVDYGPGYRVYFGQKGRTLVVLLCGGDKRTQDRDIPLAKQYWREFKASDL